MLKRRIATAVVMLVIFALDLFYAPSGLFALSIALLCAATGWEWGRLAGIQTDTGEVLFAILVGLSALICLYLPFSDAVLRLFFGAVLLFWLLVPLLFKARPAHAPMPHADVGLLCIGVVLITAAAIAIEYLRAQAPHASPWLLLFAFVIVWSMDIGAYFSGRRFGSHKLSPAISPGKTWEGVWGGVAVAILVLALVLAFVDLPPGIALPLILATGTAAVTSVVGDLYESRIKRAAGRKDSSRLLPGHGGVLDRFDGVIAALPAFAAVWVWV